MLKYVLFFLIISAGTSDALERKYREGSIYNYKYRQDYYDQETLEFANKENGQLSLQDYKKSVNNLIRSKRKKIGNIEEDFIKKDYNKNGFISSDELKLYNREKELKRRKTKQEQKNIEVMKEKGIYIDPVKEIEALKKKIEEEVKEEEEK